MDNIDIDVGIKNLNINVIKSKTKNRSMICMDFITYLNSITNLEGSLMCAMPDIDDISFLSKSIFISSDQRIRNYAYKKWFIDCVELIFNKLNDGEYAIFSQTDSKIINPNSEMIGWNDKSVWIALANEKCNCNCNLMWHKISTCLDDNNIIGGYRYRPCYTHLICYGKNVSYSAGDFMTPDIIDRGEMISNKSMGVESCILCMCFLKYVSKTSCVVNPFSGYGTILAVANYFDLKSIGIEISQKRANISIKRDIEVFIEKIPKSRLIMLGMKFPPIVDNNIVDNTLKDLGDDSLDNNIIRD
jgi:hypothetical protein